MAMLMARACAPRSSTRHSDPVSGTTGTTLHRNSPFARGRQRLIVVALLLGHLTAQAQTAPVTFRYDLAPTSIGKLSEITDSSGVTYYTHDIGGRVATKRQSLVNGLVQQVGYDYNNSTGLLSRTTYPGGGVLGYLYDSTGRLIQLTWNGTPLVSNITWNPMSQPQSWTWTFTSPGLSASRVYDTAARLTATEFSSYVYDAAGRITSLTQSLYQPGDADPTHSTIASTSRSWNVGYDAAGRITSFNGTGTASDSTTFRYDPNGNRLASERTLDGQTTVRSYSVESGSNRITGFTQTRASVTTNVNFRYNANGDMTGDGLKTYTYDAQRRLSAVTTGASDVSPTTRYAHNALGQRVFKTEPLYPQTDGDESDQGFLQSLIAFFSQALGSATSDAEKLGYAYMYGEDGTLLAETGMGGANSAGSTQYIYLPTASGPMPIVMIVNGVKYAVHSDHLNTPRRLSDADGQPVWQWAYSPFGDEAPTLASNRFADLERNPNPGTTHFAEVVSNLRYPGQYYDRESRLIYNYFRSYDPRTGRYTQYDPIGLDGGWNGFTYVGGNPLNRTDAFGLCPFCLAAPLIGGGVTAADIAIGATGAGALIALDRLLSSGLPPGFIPGDKGAEQWGRNNGIDPNEARGRFHGIKQSDKGRGRDKYGVNPQTGEVCNPEGDVVGDLSDAPRK